jgi:hypothetical protein
VELPIPPPAFASVDGFLAYQREAVAGGRSAIDQDADAAWQRLAPEARDRFVLPLVDLMLDAGTAILWRRAWWLHAIGGRPRAPFETGTSPEKARRLADALAAALAPTGPPTDLSRTVEAWWRELTRCCRDHIAGYVAERVGAAGYRLAQEGLLDAPTAEALLDGRALSRPPRPPKRPVGEVDRRRVRQAADAMLRLHRRLDERFASLGPVCGACTRETGGCCSLTVPLLWREADYRLLALGEAAVPAPDPATAGACPFLGDLGCRLPSERRPHICRSFLCDRAQEALTNTLPEVRADLGQLNEARSRLG